jgi:hypothetical protein
LAARLTPEWVDIRGHAATDAVLDASGKSHKQESERRDATAGHRWLFCFNNSLDATTCRDAILQNAPVAFGLSPAAVTVAVAAGATGVPTIPMVFCVLRHDQQAGAAGGQCDAHSIFLFSVVPPQL